MKLNKLVLIGVLVFMVWNVSAQNPNMIIGKWVFEDATESEKAKMDSTGLKMLPMFFGDMTIYFSESGRYKFFFMNRPDEGVWKMSENQKIVNITSDKGESMEIGILELSEEILVMKLVKGSFIMKRMEPSAEDLLEPKSNEIETVSVNLDQVTKKWYLKNRELPNKTEKQKQIDEMFSENLFIKIHKNGKFEAEVLVVEDIATWEFGTDNRSIIIKSDGVNKIWHIESISDAEMVLVRGNSSEKWIFTTDSNSRKQPSQSK